MQSSKQNRTINLTTAEAIDQQEITATTNTENTTQGITLTELSSHDTKENCWVVFENNVYDISAFIPKHPGGQEAISTQCGSLTFESAFIAQHGRSKVQKMMAETTKMGAFTN